MFLESVTNLKPLVRKLTGRTPSSSVARAIAVCLQQGRLFFQSAEESALEIRPLLLFYGTMAFAKGLILAHDLSSLATLPHAHGVKDTSPATSPVSDITLRIDSRGTFQRFNDVVSSISAFRYHTNRGQPGTLLLRPAATSSELDGLEIGLKDILSRFAVLGDMYRDTFQTAPASEYINLYLDHNGHWELRIDDPRVYSDRTQLVEIIEDWRTRFPDLKKWRVTEAARAWGKTAVLFANVGVPANESAAEILREGGDRLVADIDWTQELQFIPRDILSSVGGLLSGGHYLSSPFHGKHISEYALHYLGMYLLSSLVRYRPQTWVHAISGVQPRRIPLTTTRWR